MADLQALISKLEQSTGPSREMDAQIYVAIGWPSGALTDEEYTAAIKSFARQSNYAECGAFEGRAPEYTGSLDAALTLAPNGWIKRLSEIRFGLWLAELWCGDKSFREPPDAHSVAVSWSLALVIASLKARAQTTGESP